MRFILLLRYTLLNHIDILFTGRVQVLSRIHTILDLRWDIPHGYYTSSESVQCTAHIGRNSVVFFIIVHSITHVLFVRLEVSRGYAPIMCYPTIHNVKSTLWSMSKVDVVILTSISGILGYWDGYVILLVDCIIIVLYILCICVYIYVRV